MTLIGGWEVRRLWPEESSIVLDGCGSAVGLDRLDARISRLNRGIHLTGTDDLVIGSLEVEEKLAVGSLFPIIPVVVGTVGLNRSDAVHGGRFSLVQFAGEDSLGVARLEDETELTITALAEFEPAGHGLSPWID